MSGSTRSSRSRAVRWLHNGCRRTEFVAVRSGGYHGPNDARQNTPVTYAVTEVPDTAIEKRGAPVSHDEIDMSIQVPAWDGTSRLVKELWRIEEDGHVASCSVWTHAEGGELRLTVDGFVRRRDVTHHTFALPIVALAWQERWPLDPTAVRRRRGVVPGG